MPILFSEVGAIIDIRLMPCFSHAGRKSCFSSYGTSHRRSPRTSASAAFSQNLSGP